MSARHLSTSFRQQARACGALGSPMYAALLERVAEDIDAGGPCADVLAGHEDASGPSGTALRLLGSVHRLVLQRRAGALATYYPSVGGTWEVEGGWAAFRDLVAEAPDDVREWLDHPPQTNEIGRSAALLGGLLELTSRLGDLPLRLHEIGASGGLNLHADRFAYVSDDARSVGPADSPVTLRGAWSGAVPLAAPWPRVIERRGTDLRPVDVGTTEGRLLLTAYVWPDQTERHERLRGALDLARSDPVVVRRSGAAEAVQDLELTPGSCTVLWHSVLWQYLDAAEQERVAARIAELGASADGEMPFAHLFLEPTRRAPGHDHEFLVVLELWPAGTRTVLATSSGHGLPTAWERPVDARV